MIASERFITSHSDQHSSLSNLGEVSRSRLRQGFGGQVGRETEHKPCPSLVNLVSHLRSNWRDEGLPENWYDLRTLGGKQVGFSMNREMELLTDTSPEGIALGLDRTESNLRGFCLEYLSKSHRLYPGTYNEQKNPDGSIDLINQMYQADILDITSPDERDGEVVRQLKRVKSFFTNPTTPEGALAVMVSPLGPTGLVDDNNIEYEYLDSFVFFWELGKQRNVIGFGLQTDFSLSECRDAIEQLNKVKLPDDLSLAEYVARTALIDPEKHSNSITSIENVLTTLEQVRRKHSGGVSNTVYEGVTWADVRSDLGTWEELYNFGPEVNEILGEFREIATSIMSERSVDAHVRERRLREATVGTILLLTRHFGEQEQKEDRLRQTMHVPHASLISYDTRGPVDMGRSSTVFDDTRFQAPLMSWSDWMEKATSQSGCGGGGGGKTRTVHSIAPREVKMIENGGSSPLLERACQVCGTTEEVDCGYCKTCAPPE